MAKFKYADSDNPKGSTFRDEPLIIPPALCAVRLPTGFRCLLDDFSREVLREQPCDIDQFGAEFFGGLLERQRRGESTEYHPKVSYIEAQFEPGNRVIVPTCDQNPKGTQTTASTHHFTTSESSDSEENEIFYTKEPKTRTSQEIQPEEPPVSETSPKHLSEFNIKAPSVEEMAQIDSILQGFQEDIAISNLLPIPEEDNA